MADISENSCFGFWGSCVSPIKNKMASEVNVSKKKKKYSKKTKRNWRKQTDIKDVEEYLEEVRRDERTGLVKLVYNKHNNVFECVAILHVGEHFCSVPLPFGRYLNDE